MAEIISEINEAQNFWLRLQGHVVDLSEKRSNQLNSIHLARKRKTFFIFSVFEVNDNPFQSRATCHRTENSKNRYGPGRPKTAR